MHLVMTSSQYCYLHVHSLGLNLHCLAFVGHNLSTSLGPEEDPTMTALLRKYLHC